MASLDDTARSLIDKSYPQAKDADSDPVKLSSAVFSNTEVSLLKKRFLTSQANSLPSIPQLKRRRSSNGLLRHTTSPRPLKTVRRRPNACHTSTHTCPAEPPSSAPSPA